MWREEEEEEEEDKKEEGKYWGCGGGDRAGGSQAPRDAQQKTWKTWSGRCVLSLHCCPLLL